MRQLDPPEHPTPPPSFLDCQKSFLWPLPVLLLCAVDPTKVTLHLLAFSPPIYFLFRGGKTMHLSPHLGRCHWMANFLLPFPPFLPRKCFSSSALKTFSPTAVFYVAARRKGGWGGYEGAKCRVELRREGGMLLSPIFGTKSMWDVFFFGGGN